MLIASLVLFYLQKKHNAASRYYVLKSCIEHVKYALLMPPSIDMHMSPQQASCGNLTWHAPSCVT